MKRKATAAGAGKVIPPLLRAAQVRHTQRRFKFRDTEQRVQFVSIVQYFGQQEQPRRNSGPRPSYKSGSGKSYSASFPAMTVRRKSYTSGKSYTASSELPKSSARPAFRSDSDPSGFNFDNAAARARKEEASRREFSRFEEAQRAPAASREITPPVSPSTRSASTPTDSAIASNLRRSPNRRSAYVPDDRTIVSRPARMPTVLSLRHYVLPWCIAIPITVCSGWWLLDCSLDDPPAYWAYHHRYDMDPARYRAGVAKPATRSPR